MLKRNVARHAEVSLGADDAAVDVDVDTEAPALSSAGAAFAATRLRGALLFAAAFFADVAIDFSVDSAATVFFAAGAAVFFLAAGFTAAFFAAVFLA